MKRTPIRKISIKQAEKLALWNDITMSRIHYLIAKYGKPLCEWCGTEGYVYDNESLFYLRGHHIDEDRKNNTPENCYVCHNVCHLYITDNNKAVQQEGFEGRE